MSKKLIIAEKPSVAGDIARALGGFMVAGVPGALLLAAGTFFLSLVPIGTTAAGLPVGMQVIAPMGHDYRVLRAAEIWRGL